MLTAGHCVFDIHSTRKMVSALNFSPGMNGNSHPNGVAEWKSVRVLQQFTAEVRSCLSPSHGSHMLALHMQWRAAH